MVWREATRWHYYDAIAARSMPRVGRDMPGQRTHWLQVISTEQWLDMEQWRTMLNKTNSWNTKQLAKHTASCRSLSRHLVPLAKKPVTFWKTWVAASQQWPMNVGRTSSCSNVSVWQSNAATRLVCWGLSDRIKNWTKFFIYCNWSVYLFSIFMFYMLLTFCFLHFSSRFL